MSQGLFAASFLPVRVDSAFILGSEKHFDWSAQDNLSGHHHSFRLRGFLGLLFLIQSALRPDAVHLILAGAGIDCQVGFAKMDHIDEAFEQNRIKSLARFLLHNLESFGGIESRPVDPVGGQGTRSEVRASKTSAIQIILAPMGISSPFKPRGYPLPSIFS